MAGMDGQLHDNQMSIGEESQETIRAQRFEVVRLDRGQIPPSLPCRKEAMKDRIYLAARYSRRIEMEQHKLIFEIMGFEVVSRWHRGSHEINDDESAFDQNVKFAEEDLEDLKSADIVIHFTEVSRTNNGRGGRHVELGLALAYGKENHIIGPRENIFHYLKEVHKWEDINNFIKAVQKGE